MILTMLTQMMRYATLLIGCLSLTGCSDFDITVERCVPVVEGREDFCRCHKYRISDEFIGRSGESRDEPLRYCSRFVSFSPDDWVAILQLLREGADQSDKDVKIETWVDVQKDVGNL